MDYVGHRRDLVAVCGNGTVSSVGEADESRELQRALRPLECALRPRLTIGKLQVYLSGCQKGAK